MTSSGPTVSSKLLLLAGLLYVGVGFGYIRQTQWPEAGAWFCYALANGFFAYRAFTQGN